MAHLTVLDNQRAAFLATLGDTAANRALTHPELLYAWLGANGHTQATLQGRLAAWCAANGLSMTEGLTQAGLLSGLGPELVVNGGFDDASAWTLSATAPATATIAAGKLTLVSPAGEAAFARQDVLIIGRTYQVDGVCTVRSGGFRVTFGSSATGTGIVSVTASGAFTATGLANGTDGRLFVTRNGACDVDIDSISVHEVLNP